jgi:23S rRNA (cytosine1962-C5)-methyltransferase
MIEHITTAIEHRTELIHTLHQEETDCYRLFHGATEGIPGLSIDRYGSILLMQTWREALGEDQANQIADHICTQLGISLSPVWNHRQKRGRVEHHVLRDIINSPVGKELGVEYDVSPVHDGIDPLLFLDFRSARRWIRTVSQNKTVLNLFSYTCGMGVVACLGQAKQVLNIDFSMRSLQIGEENARRNNIPLKPENSSSQFSCIKDDVFPVIRQFSGLGIKGRAARRPFIKRTTRQFDIVILDPPRISKSPFGKVDLVGDYPSLFKPALLSTKPGGWLLATNNVASVSKEVWHEQLVRCAQKAGVSIQHWTSIHPEADFPSPDENWPLKMMLCQREK